MIGQTAGMTPLTGVEPVQHFAASEGVNSPENVPSGSLKGGVDSTSLSVVALALARNVPPAGESAEQGATRPDESENMVKKSLEKQIDIRV